MQKERFYLKNKYIKNLAEYRSEKNCMEISK